MNLHLQKSEISQLNIMMEKILRNWALIVECDLELSICCESDDHTPSKDRIVNYDISRSIWTGIGDLTISDQGGIEERVDSEIGVSTFIVGAAMNVCFPAPMMELFRKHAASDTFETELEYLGLSVVLEFNGHDSYEFFSYLSNALQEAKLDAFTETLLRPNAGSLLADIQPYAEWLEYAAAQSESIYDIARRERLIDDLHLVLLYLSQGGRLHFAKLTSLCDVAGSLQPVRNLIKQEMPELAV